MPDPLARARRMDDAELTSLADLEWRSRSAARALYHSAHEALSELGSTRQWVQAHAQARLAVEGRGLGVEVETLAKDAILSAAMERLHGAALTNEQRSVLRRPWRTLLKALGETP